jgi:hypothetical protein
MKATCSTLILSCTLLLSMSGVGQAGICIDQTGYCNDFFLAFTRIESNVFQLHGYEYGCGYFDRILSGSIHTAGGYAYYGLSSASGSSCAWDNGCGGSWAAVLNISTGEGTAYWNYYYTSGGSHSGHSGSSSLDSNYCSDPALSAGVTEPDAALTEELPY